MQTYDPQLFSIEVAGLTINGFADGTFIKAMFNEDAYTIKIGADGQGVRVRNANSSGRFEITLLPSSPANATLAALSIMDRLTGKGAVPVFILDGSGTATASATKAWIIKQADLERAKEMGDVTWTMETLNMQLLQGGINDNS